MMFMALHSSGRRRPLLIAASLSLLMVGLGVAVMLGGI
jgi:hypothetical protein